MHSEKGKQWMQETFGYLFCPTQVNILKKFANFLLDEACWSFMCPVYITCIRCGREKENVLSCMACTVWRYMYLWAAIFSSSFFLLLANSEYLLLPTFSSSECAAQADSPFLSALLKKNLFFLLVVVVILTLIDGRKNSCLMKYESLWSSELPMAYWLQRKC